jgi:hypothetical protein
MHIALPDAGAANAEIVRLCQETRIDAVAKAGISLVGFDPAAPVAERIRSCPGRGLQRVPADDGRVHAHPARNPTARNRAGHSPMARITPFGRRPREGELIEAGRTGRGRQRSPVPKK